MPRIQFVMITVFALNIVMTEVMIHAKDAATPMFWWLVDVVLSALRILLWYHNISFALHRYAPPRIPRCVSFWFRMHPSDGLINCVRFSCTFFRVPLLPAR